MTAYNGKVHDTQKKILQLSTSYKIEDLTLREIGELIGVPHPQIVKHHIEQLKKKGFLKIDSLSGKLSPVIAGEVTPEKLINIPILGNANCGEATMFAEEYLVGYLKVSTSILNKDLLPKVKDLFAVKAYGESMNKAKVPTNRATEDSIQQGDYVIVDSKATNPKTGDYILSIIEGSANIKKFVNDTANNQIVLLSESTLELPPIHIDPSMSYLINGKVVQVIKSPK